MKAKKAMKRLHRVETLLGNVIDQYEAGTPEVHELLDAARTSVASATEALAARLTITRSVQRLTARRQASSTATSAPLSSRRPRWPHW